MATVRQVRRSIVVALWFIFSMVRAWPSRLLSGRPTGEPRVQNAIMLQFTPAARNVRYGVELGLRPARARLVRLTPMPTKPRISPAAFVARLPRIHPAAAQANQAQIIRTTGTTRPPTGTTHTTACTSAPPPVPPPTTVPETTAPPTSPACSRTTINTVCAKIGATAHCAVRDCCWSQDHPISCQTISTYTQKNTFTTHTTTTFTTWSTGFCHDFFTCY